MEALANAMRRGVEEERAPMEGQTQREGDEGQWREDSNGQEQTLVGSKLASSNLFIVRLLWLW